MSLIRFFSIHPFHYLLVTVAFAMSLI